MTLRSPQSPLGTLNGPEQLFCCAIADDRAWHEQDLRDFWRSVGDAQAWSFAVKNRAESIVGLALSTVLKTAELNPRWVEAVTQCRARITSYMKVLDYAASVLKAHDIPMVALKNSGIARGLVADLAACPMGDIDVLVKKAQFDAADRVLRQSGFRLLGSNDKGRANLATKFAEFDCTPATPGADDEQNVATGGRTGGTEYFFPAETGEKVWFELQWRAIAGGWIQAEQEPQAESLIARSQAIAGSSARILAPEDNLLQVCLHTAKHKFIVAPGFRLHTDVDRIVRRCPIEWNRFVETTMSHRVKTAVYLALLIPYTLLRTPIPTAILDQLQPGRRKRQLLTSWLHRVGLFDPDRPKWGKVGNACFNVLMYDDPKSVWRAIFPPVNWMREQYQCNSQWTLAASYTSRICRHITRTVRH